MNCFRLPFPMGFKLFLAYICVYTHFASLFSLLTIFNIGIGNIGNNDRKALGNKDFRCFRLCCQCCRSETTGNKRLFPMRSNRKQKLTKVYLCLLCSFCPFPVKFLLRNSRFHDRIILECYVHLEELMWLLVINGSSTY